MTTNTPLTPRQQQVLELLRRHIDANGYPPTLRELAAELGVSGTLPVSKHLEALERKGQLTRGNGPRSICLQGSAQAVSLPIVGTVQAGQLTPAIEDVQGHLALDRTSLNGGSFLLRVRGDSMIEAAILDGDLALIRPQTTAENRDIVVAMLNGEATLKRFYRESAEVIRLQPENSSLQPIILTAADGEVALVGKVVGIIRNLD